MEKELSPGRQDETASTMELTRSSSLIFSGTVVTLGESTVPILPPSEDFVVIRVDRGLRVDPALGDLRGKLITMAPLNPGSLRPEQRAVFFTLSWIHGGGIAVREIGHLDVGKEDEVAEAVERLPEMHLRDRLLDAELVAVAEVVSVREMPRTSYARNAAVWAEAQLRIERVLRGQPRESAAVYFPTADRPPWTDAPRFEEGQRGVFILHAASQKETRGDRSLEAGSLVALDPTDFQPESELPQVETLIAAVERDGGGQ